MDKTASSPRAWGCFDEIRKTVIVHRVFPTCVGVFPWEGDSVCAADGLPHVRGGVSVSDTPTGSGPKSSPRAWGCF